LGLYYPSNICSRYLTKWYEIRKPHFAHFKGTDPRQVEKCELRAAAYDNNTENISSIEDREQRLEIFQTHFLNMIFIGEDKIVDDSKFNKWINLITLTHSQIINNITKGCTEYFLTHRQLIESKYIVPRTEIKDREILLQQEIALEAMSYLCVKSSRSLLGYIMHYSIYKLHNQPQEYNLLKRINTEENILGICLFTAKIIILNPWVRAFGKITASDTIINPKKISIVEEYEIKPKNTVKTRKNLTNESATATGQRKLFRLNNEVLDKPGSEYNGNYLVYEPIEYSYHTNENKHFVLDNKLKQFCNSINVTNQKNILGKIITQSEHNYEVLGIVVIKKNKLWYFQLPREYKKTHFVSTGKTIDQIIPKFTVSKGIVKSSYTKHTTNQMLYNSEIQTISEFKTLSSDIVEFLSIHGLRNNNPILPSKLHVIWSRVLNLKLDNNSTIGNAQPYRVIP